MKNSMIFESETRVTSTTGLMFMAAELMREQYDSKSHSETKVELKDKKLLSVEEAAELFGIGRGKIRELSDSEDCKFVIWIGAHRKIKRDAFEQFVMQQYSL